MILVPRLILYQIQKADAKFRQLYKVRLPRKVGGGYQMDTNSMPGRKKARLNLIRITASRSFTRPKMPLRNSCANSSSRVFSLNRFCSPNKRSVFARRPDPAGDFIGRSAAAKPNPRVAHGRNPS